MYVIQSVFPGNQASMKLIFLLLSSRGFLLFSFAQGKVDFPDDVLVGKQSFATQRGANNTEEVEAANSFNSLERSRRYRIVLVVQPTGRAMNFALFFLRLV